LASLSPNPTCRGNLVGMVERIVITVTIVALLTRLLRVYLLYLEGRSARKDISDWVDTLSRSYRLEVAAGGSQTWTNLRRQQDYSFP
jgi:hypothetical protein